MSQVLANEKLATMPLVKTNTARNPQQPYAVLGTIMHMQIARPDAADVFTV